VVVKCVRKVFVMIAIACLSACPRRTGTYGELVVAEQRVGVKTRKASVKKKGGKLFIIPIRYIYI